MLKRQESSLSSSRRLQSAAATPPPPATTHAKSIGCMSGIIHLFSKYQNPNKRLTFGKKQVKRKPPSPETKPVKEDKAEKQDFDDEAKKLKCEIKFPRSPTIPAEIRRSGSTASSPRNQRTPSSLVARLMGLEDMGSAAPARTAAFDNLENPITEKRQRLLQALEKCNEDLEALKKIIKAVQTSDVRHQPPHTEAKKRVHSGGNAGSVAAKPCIKKCTEAEANSPVGAVDELTRSPPLNNFSAAQSTAPGAARVPLQRKPTALATAAKKPGEDYDQLSMAKILINSKCSAAINDSFSSLLLMRRRAAASPPWSSRAMVQSVEEVCGDVAWGEKREIGRIGLVLQDHLCRELIDDLVKDLLKLPKCSNLNIALPLEACKKRLCF